MKVVKILSKGDVYVSHDGKFWPCCGMHLWLSPAGKKYRGRLRQIRNLEQLTQIQLVLEKTKQQSRNNDDSALDTSSDQFLKQIDYDCMRAQR
ncbi:MAG: hypothetical protein FIO04_06350 [Nitrosopumilales archaeon]|nr:hypothetical protein [Nitrosopumilales archaeon]